MKRRMNGEGTIFKETKKGNSYYRTQITYTDAYGNKKRKSFSAKTSDELLEKIETWKNKEIEETLTHQEDENLTLNEWIHKFLYIYKKGNIKPTSLARYVTIWEKDIKKYPIGKILLKNLKTLNMQQHISTLKAEKKSIPKIKRAKELISTSLNFAATLDLIPTNKARHAVLPKDYRKKDNKEYFNILEAKDQKTIIQNLPNDPYGLAIEFDFATGLRKGELLALTWDDIDMDQCTVTINATFMQAHIINDVGEKEYRKELTSPKSQTGYRTIPYPKRFNIRLKKLKLEQRNEKYQHSEIYQDNNLVFCDELGRFLDKKRLPRLLDRVCDKTGIKHIKFHAIRHCYATRLFENNIDIKTVSKLLGHKTTDVTQRIYTHVTEQKMQDVNNIIQKYV